MRLINEIDQGNALLATVLGVDSKTIRALVERFPSLHEMQVAGRQELDMLTPVKAKRLQALLQLAEKIHAPQVDGDYVRKPQDVASFLQMKMRFLTKEIFVCLFLNTKNRIIAKEVVSTGGLNACLVHPREVFKLALRYSAASVVCVHNHPSGDPTPSTEDISLTKRLAEAGETLGIDLLDHVILGGTDWYSLKEQNLF